MEIKIALRKYIAENLVNGIADDSISDDTNLLATGMVDSLGMYQLVTHAEELLKVKIPVEDVTIENFGTLQDIANYLNLATTETQTGSPG